ncbi:MAG: prolyl oligopeptidase family serine peptidase, partial [Candidatus Limnocylindrales bacterium]
MSSTSDLSVRPYGAWPSPISADMVVAGARSLREARVDGDTIYWIEARADEGGRYAIVARRPDGSIRDVTPRESNARTMVHEYGGGSYAVRDGLVVFSNLPDGRLWTLDGDGSMRPITGEGAWRYADLFVDARRDGVLCVREDHTNPAREAVNEIVSVGLHDGAVTVLVSGADFYSHPRLDAAGVRLCWLSWMHPDMPWDATQLWVAAMGDDGGLGPATCVAGGPDESISQPEWSPDGSLVACSDRTGWINLYRFDPVDGSAVAPAPMEAEVTGPQWVFGQSAFAVGQDGSVVTKARRHGADALFHVRRDGTIREIDQPYPEIGSVRWSGDRVVYIGMAPDSPSAVVGLDLTTDSLTVIHASSELAVDRAFLSRPEFVTFPTTGGSDSYALFYAPVNPEARAPEGERPPLVVISHGGPTANATASLDLEIQYLTSRGFAVADVDYRGSTGYGRAY